MLAPESHEDCAPCVACDRHLDPTEQWPCPVCGAVLCDVHECPTSHPTVVHNMPEDDYHGHPALSASGAKLILKAPALYRYRRANPVTSDVFDLGHAAHTKVLGVGPQTAVIDAPDWRSTAAREARDAARAEGKVPPLAREAARVEAMADALSQHTFAMRLLSEGEPEVSMFAQHETGVPIRGRLDWLGKRIVSDYKSAASSEPAAFARAAATFGYHISAAVYIDLCQANDIDVNAFAFIVQEKEPPYLVSVVELDYEAISRGRDLFDRACRIFRDCTESGVWPGYGRDDGWTTVSLPPWALRDNYQEEHIAS